MPAFEITPPASPAGSTGPADPFSGAATLTTIPVAPQNPSQSQITTLDGRRYSIRLEWIARLSRWAVDLSTESGTPILRCKVAALRADLLRQVRYRTDVPPGVLMMVDTLGLDAEAGLTTLGGRHRLIYFSE